MTLLAAAGTVLALALPVAASAPALASLLGRGARWPGRLFAASLALGALGLASLPVFPWRLVGGRLAGPFVAADLATFATLTVASAWLARRSRPVWSHASGAGDADGTARWVGLAALAVVAVAAAWGAAAQAQRFPHGQWDAWAVWNLRARFLYRAADGYAALAADPPLSHFDYPLLLPASVARLWAYAAGESTLAPALLGGLFTFGAAALCGSALAALRGGSAALAGTILVLANSDFLIHGQSQYADVPAGYYLLAALALIAWHEEVAPAGGRPWALLLAGLAAGLAAWTKNEGFLFVAAILAVRSAGALRSRDFPGLRREVAWLAAGLALPLACLALYKLATPHRNWLLDTPAGPLTDRLLDWGRLRLILEEFGRTLFGFGFGAGLVAAGAALLLSRGAGARPTRSSWPLGAVGLVLAGYVAVFMASPFDLRWHLDTTVSRLLSQVWPAAIFALIYAAAPVTAPPPSPAAPGSPPGAGRTPG